MTTDIQSASITVPGASLHYERRGTGPVLILIPGGPQDAGVFSGLAAALADRFTVIAIDPRGNSRSAFTGAAEPLSVDRAADDVAALIEALGEGPVRVFGTSGGRRSGSILRPGIRGWSRCWRRMNRRRSICFRTLRLRWPSTGRYRKSI